MPAKPPQLPKVSPTPSAQYPSPPATWLASGTIFRAKRLTRSLKVAEKRRIWMEGLAERSALIMRTVSSAKASCCRKGRRGRKGRAGRGAAA